MHYRTIPLSEVEPDFILLINQFILVVDAVEHKDGKTLLIMHQAFYVMTSITYEMPSETGVYAMFGGNGTEH